MVRVATLGLLVVVLAVAWSQSVAAQPVAQPYEGCQSDPEWCDAQAANGDVTRTGDQPVRVILYAHVRDLLQRAPMNTEPPAPEEGDPNAGFLMPTFYTDTPAPCCRFPNNEFTWYTSPGPVEVLEDERWRIHQQPGFAYNLSIVGDEVHGFFYLSPGQPQLEDSGAGVLPAVGVHMRWATGRFPGQGVTLAEGDTGLGYGDPDASRLGGTVTLVSRPMEDPVYEFHVVMRVQNRTLPSIWDAGQDGERVGSVVDVHPYQYDDGRVSFTQNDWRLRAGALYPPRLVVDTEPPLRTESTRVNQRLGRMVAEWEVLAALGTNDVDRSSFAIEVTGPSSIEPELISTRVSPSHAGVFLPVTATWVHALPEEGLHDGVYEVEASVLNKERTYRLEWHGAFQVRDGRVVDSDAVPLTGNAQSPGPGAAALVVLLAASAWVAGAVHRRDHEGF